MSSTATELHLRYEYVRCALCGEDNTEVKFRVNTRRLRLSSVWVNGVRHPLDRIETIVACRTCGLVYVNPRLAPDPHVATYTAEQEWQYFKSTREIRRWAYSHLIRQLPTWLGRTPQTLLDIGCGDGVLVEVAREAGIASVGSEISPSLIQHLRARLGHDAVVSGDLTTLPEAHYDVVTLINVVEHLRYPGQVLQTVAHRLRPDGIAVVHTLNLGGLPARIYRERWHQIEPLEHLYYFTAQTLSALMRKAGLEPIARFNLVISRGVRGKVQRTLGKLGLYLDNGLGVVARRSQP